MDYEIELDEKERISGLIKYEGIDKVVDWRDYLQDHLETEKNAVRYYSGFTELDSLVDGFQTGELITVSGYTGMGKTLFIKSLIRGFSKNLSPICLFCYEDKVESWLSQYKEEDLDFPIFVPMKLQTGNLKWLEDRITESKLKFSTKIIAIDHLHYLLDFGHGKENMSLKIGSIMRCLKRLAVDLDVIIFIVAHQEKVKDNEEASLNTIRDSSLIGQESDDVIIVQRLPDDTTLKPKDQTFDVGYSMVKIDKSRRSGVFRKRLTFQKKGNWLDPL